MALPGAKHENEEEERQAARHHHGSATDKKGWVMTWEFITPFSRHQGRKIICARRVTN
jgi:hypothetical protein